MPRPAILRNLRVKRVALVDNGANLDKRTGDGAHILLYKSAPSVSDVHVDSTEWEKSDLTTESRDALPDSAFAAVWSDSGGKHRKLPIHDAGHLAAARGRIDGADIPADIKAAARRRIEAATKTKEKAVKKSVFKSFLDLFTETDPAKRVAKVAELEKAFPDDQDDEKPVHKADDAMCKCADCVAMRSEKLDKGLQKRFEALESENRELKKSAVDALAIAKAERETRLNSEMYTLLKGFVATPFTLEGADSDVMRFRKMKEDDPTGFDRTITILKAQDAQLASSMAFRDFGSGRMGTSEGSAWAQIEAKAEALVVKHGDLTMEQRIEKVLLDPANNKLVQEYRKQQ